MIKVTTEFLDKLSLKAEKSERKRAIHRFHKEDSDTLQRMLNAMQKSTYVQPHRHITPVKREAFVILRGKVVVIEFDNSGKITDYCILSKESGSFLMDISEKAWHTIISLEDNSVVYEIKDGPYIAKSDKEFAAWAPSENDDNRLEYNELILKNINL